MTDYIWAIFRVKRWTVNRKINFSFVVLIILLLLNGIIVFYSILSLNQTNRTDRQKTSELADAQAYRQNLQNTLTAYNDAIYITQQKAVNPSYFLLVNENLGRLKISLNSQPGPAISPVSQISQSYEQLQALFAELNKYLLAGEIAQAANLWQANAALREVSAAAADYLVLQLQSEKNQLAVQSDFAANLTLVATLVTFGLTTVIAGFFAWFLSRNIGKPLSKIQKYLDSFAADDSDQPPLQIANRDEIGDLAQALNRSFQVFRGIIESLNIGSQMREASRNLKDISFSQSESAVDQVGYVSQIVNSMQEQSSSAKSISENADFVVVASHKTLSYIQELSITSLEMSQMVGELRQKIGQSQISLELANTDFNYVIESLDSVEAQSASTSQVINIISNIAQNTHLLALNAAIEAAGAGQLGERFRVVAREIRGLAVSTNDSISRIKELLNTIQLGIRETQEQARLRQRTMREAVLLGSEVDEAVSETLQKVEANQQVVQAILQAASNSAEQSSQIKSAAYQQQIMSKEVLQAVRTISQLVDETALNSSTITSISTDLDSLSDLLTGQLNSIHLPKATNGTVTSA